MVVIYSSFTSPVNPPDALPVLYPAQLWAAMQRKVRHAQEFVPVFVSCDVMSEELDPENEAALVVTRNVVFKEGHGPSRRAGKPVKEVIKSYEPCKVDFHQDDGTVIQNIITTGVDVDGEEGLYLTYILEHKYADIPLGGKEHRDHELVIKKVGSFQLSYL
ncbi:hypothetical protein MMC10_011387 [Thelotrema lepadinum]|nr:hypothetical protein [Thelotrema lepadinum]